MNAHVLAATHTRKPDRPGVEAWVEHCAAIHCAWIALDQAVREELAP